MKKSSGKFLVKAAEAYNNPKKKYQKDGEWQGAMMLPTDVMSKTAKDTMPAGNPPAYQTRKFSKEELAEMHKGKKYGPGFFQKMINKMGRKSSGGGGFIPAIKGACGPHGCLKPGRKTGGAVKKKK